MERGRAIKSNQTEIKYWHIILNYVCLFLTLVTEQDNAGSADLHVYGKNDGKQKVTQHVTAGPTTKLESAARPFFFFFLLEITL